MKIKCPVHVDVNPSLHIYGEYAHCFVCGFRTRTENVIKGYAPSEYTVEKEDISKTLEYIDGLGTIRIRGLEFPADERGFYVVWRDRSFYKKRLFEGKSRYIGPKGHKPPMYCIPGYIRRFAVVIEGELNAISLAQVYHRTDIISPGSATELTKHMPYYLTNYDTFAIVVDRDIPGVVNGVKLRDELLRNKKKVQLIAVEKDINEILQEKGQEGVKTWAKENLGMPFGL